MYFIDKFAYVTYVTCACFALQSLVFQSNSHPNKKKNMLLGSNLDLLGSNLDLKGLNFVKKI